MFKKGQRVLITGADKTSRKDYSGQKGVIIGPATARGDLWDVNVAGKKLVFRTEDLELDSATTKLSHRPVVLSLAQDAAVRAGKMTREEALRLAENKRVEGPEREPKASTQLLNKCDKAVGKVMQAANALNYGNTRDGRSTYSAKLDALKKAVSELETLTNKIAE